MATFLDKSSNARPVFLVDGNGNPITGGTSALSAGVDRSGTITTANTAQDVAPVNASRIGLTIQNVSDTNMIVAESGVSASATVGYVLQPYASIQVNTNQRISIFCTVAGKRFAATEY